MIFLYFLIGTLITLFVDVYTKRSGMGDAQFNSNKERFFMILLWPIFVGIVIYNTIKYYNQIKKK